MNTLPGHGAPHLRPRSHHFALEARQLFDGAALVEAAHAAEPAPAEAADAHRAADTAPLPTAATPASAAVDDRPGGPEAAPAAPVSVYVIDQSIAGWQSLAEQVPPGSEVILIDGGSAGSAQLAQALAGRSGIGALHILSHGSEGGIALGNQNVTGQTLSASADDWRAIGAALTADGDILLYGCDVAAGGGAFIEQLAAITQADVAASTGATGAAALGGDWTLEARAGQIETRAFTAEGYAALLAAPQVNDAGTALATLEDTNLSITSVSISDSDGGTQTVTLTSSTGTLTLVNGLGGIAGLVGNGSGSVSFSGTVAQVNAALQGMLFRGLQDRSGAAAFNVAVTDGETATNRDFAVSITAVNDAPELSGATPALTVAEGGQAAFAAAVNLPGAGFTQSNLGLSDRDNQQVQVILKLTSLPTEGVLLLAGKELAVGSTFSVDQIDQLVYRHNGTQVLTARNDSFQLTIDDGAGGILSNRAFEVRLEPVNQAPDASGTIRVIEGESGVSLFANGNLPTIGSPRGAIAVTDPDQAVGVSHSYKVTLLPTTGTLFYDGVAITAGNMAAIDIADLALLTYSHDGSEPATTGRTLTFNLAVTDDGGGTGVATTSIETITLQILDNNDDPVLVAHETQSLVDDHGGASSFTVTPGMLQVSDTDSFDTSLTYTLTAVPDPTLGYLTLSGGLLIVGSTFTQDDIDSGRIVYHVNNYTALERTDTFAFTVKDGGIRLYPDVPGSREGGIYDTPTSTTLQVNTFEVIVPGGVGQPGVDLPLPAVAPTPTVNGDKTFIVNEAGSYVLDATDLAASDGQTPATALVYRLNTLPSNGAFFLNGVELGLFGSFTQDDVNNGRVSFTHAGAEDFSADFQFSVSNGRLETAAQNFTITATPQNDTPTAAIGPDRVFLSEGTTVVIDDRHIVLADSDRAADAPGGTLYAETNALSFLLTALPTHGFLTLDGVTPLTLGAEVTAAQLAAGDLRYVHDGSENFADGFRLTPRDNQGVAATVGTNQASVGAELVVPITISPVNDAPVFGSKSQLVAGEAGPIAEGSTTVIGGVGVPGAHLVYTDTDNTDVQRQYRLTAITQHGQLLLNGAVLGLGSVFTQADLDAGRVSYRHDGTNTSATDQFSYVVSDGDFSANDTTAFAQGVAPVASTFLIEITPTNDAPTVAAPGGPVRLDNAAGGDPLAGFTVGDVDIGAGNTDVMQVVVRLLNANGTPFSQAQYEARPVTLDATVSGGAVKELASTGGGADGYLVLRGTREQINAALATLTVSFAADQDAVYQVQVIADDRVRDLATGALVDTDPVAAGLQAIANGGVDNQNGGSPVPVPTADGFDWYAVAASGVPAGLAGNMGAASVRIFASSVNDVPTFTGPASLSVFEDQALFIGGGFTIGDAESEAFNTPVTVTFSIPVGQGTLSIGTLAGVTVASSTVGGNQVLTLTGRADLIEGLVTRTNGAVVGTGLTYTTPAGGNLDYNAGAPGSVTLTVGLQEGSSAVGGAVGAGASATNAVADLSIPITIVPINDRPGVTASGPTQPLVGLTPVTGFVVGDVDINGDIDANPATLDISAGETDFVQVTVRILDNATGNPLAAADYADTTDPLAPIDRITIGSSSPGTATVDATLDGTGSALVVRGTLAEVNAYLAGLQVRIEGPLANVDATYRVQVIADDRVRDRATGALGATANGGDNPATGGGAAAPSATEIDPYATAAIPAALVPNMAAAQRLVFPTDLNDPGRITVPGTLQVDEGSATVTLNATVGNITLLDPDAGSATTMTATVSVPAGFTIDSVGGSGAITVVDARTVTITGSQAAINSSLKAIVIGLPDEPGLPAASDWNGSFDVTIVYDDKGNTGVRPTVLAGDSDDPTSGNGDYAYVDTAVGSTDNALKTTRVFTLTVNAVNDAPQLADPLSTVVSIAPAQADRPAAAGGQSVTDLFANQYSDPLDPITGGSSSDSFHGVAIVGPAADPAQGAWQYQLDGTGPWIAVGSRGAANALVLDGNDRLRFVPAANFSGTPTDLTVRLVETGDGGNASAPPAGGSTVDLSGGGATGGTSRYSAGTLALRTSVAPLSLVVTDGNGIETGAATVREQGLTDGGGSQTATGSFVVNVPDGIDRITVAGTDITRAQLELLPGTPLAPIATPMGEITITSFDPDTGTVGWRFTLLTPQTHGVPEVTEAIAVSVTDTDGSTVGGTVTVLVIDDVPTARDDRAGIQLGGPSATVGGNVLAAGGAGDVADRAGADGPATVTALAGGAIGVPRVATYGTLTLNADGSYSFTVDTANPTVQNLYSGQSLVEVFTYTLTDADGDTSQATLTITILGPDNRTPPPIFNGIDRFDPPVIQQPFEPALFVQLAVQDSASLIDRLAGEIGSGRGEFGADALTDILAPGQDMSNAQHVSRDGVAFSVQLLAEGQSRARALGNSLVLGAETLFDDFSPFGPQPAERGDAADAPAAEPAPATPAAPAGPSAEAAPRAAPSFSAQLQAVAAARAGAGLALPLTDTPERLRIALAAAAAAATDGPRVPPAARPVPLPVTARL